MNFPPPAVAAAWIATMDGLGRGLNHALSNRINTLNTLLAVLQDARTLDAELEGAFMGEEERLESLLKLFRLAPVDTGGEPEPMVLADPVHDAAALFAHHLDLRMLPIKQEGIDTAPPVRSRRTALTHALLAALVTVARPLAGAKTSVTLSAAESGDHVEVRAVGDAPAESTDEAAFTVLEWLAGNLGGDAAHGRDAEGRPWATLRLMTLAAERKKARGA